MNKEEITAKIVEAAMFNAQYLVLVKTPLCDLILPNEQAIPCDLDVKILHLPKNEWISINQNCAEITPSVWYQHRDVLCKMFPQRAEIHNIANMPFSDFIKVPQTARIIYFSLESSPNIVAVQKAPFRVLPSELYWSAIGGRVFVRTSARTFFGLSPIKEKSYNPYKFNQAAKASMFAQMNKWLRSSETPVRFVDTGA